MDMIFDRIAAKWRGESVWILGGGSSLPHSFNVPKATITKVQKGKLPVDAFSKYLSPLEKAKVIGVNAAYLLGSVVDIVFFGDKAFWNINQDALREHGAEIVSCNSYFALQQNKNKEVTVVQKDRERRFGIGGDRTKVCWNNNSGAAAINLAVHLGAKRIYLVGFDMHSKQGRHFHNEYQMHKDPPYERHLLGFPQIKKDADALGVEIINCNPDSAITSFPTMTVQEALDYEQL